LHGEIVPVWFGDERKRRSDVSFQPLPRAPARDPTHQHSFDFAVA
jgi:hypothetical protein